MKTGAPRREAPAGAFRASTKALFGDGLARAAEFGREVPQLRQAVAHAQHRLGVVDVHARLERKRRDGRGENVDKAERWVIGHEMAAALGAELALAQRRLCSDPAFTRTASGFQRLNAFTGPPDHERHERQWQYPTASGEPVTSISTAPQKQRPMCDM